MKKLLILFLLLVTACGTPNTGNTIIECTTAEDCVPSSCCHPDSCAPKSQAPDCSDIFCSLECKPGTLDCNQGACGCINNKCQAVFN